MQSGATTKFYVFNMRNKLDRQWTVYFGFTLQKSWSGSLNKSSIK
jgi:hypothetical protein